MRLPWSMSLGHTSDRDEGHEKFLIAEYEFIRDMRSNVLERSESQLGFIITLQSAEIALVSLVAASSRVSALTIAAIAAALGIPTIILTMIVFLRSVDALTINHRYLLALNAIRGYFVNRYPEIGDAVLLPAPGGQRPFSFLRPSASVSVGAALILAVLASTMSALLTAITSWIVADSALPISRGTLLVTSSFCGLAIGISVFVSCWRIASKRTREAGSAF